MTACSEDFKSADTDHILNMTNNYSTCPSPFVTSGCLNTAGNIKENL